MSSDISEYLIDPPEIRAMCLCCPRLKCNDCIDIKPSVIQQWFKRERTSKAIAACIQQGLDFNEAAQQLRESPWLTYQYYLLYQESGEALSAKL